MSTEQKPTKEQLEAEIEDLRHAVGDTVEALTYRLDVKARAKDRIRAVPSYVPVGLAAVAATALGLWLWRRHADGH